MLPKLPTKFSKKIAIIYSKRNTLVWNHLDNLNLKIEEIFGVKYPTIRAWIDGRSEPKKSAEICEKINSFFKKSEIKKEITIDHLFGDTNIYEFAKIFNIDRNLCNLIVDEFVYSKYQLLLNYHFTDEEKANRFYAQYKGIYEIYRTGTSQSNSKDVFISCMNVRYIIKCRDSYAIRCKLHIPNSPDSHNSIDHLVQYDGFLTMLRDQLYWIFEDRNGRDFVFMITDTGLHGKPDKYLRGLYMSLNQDRPPFPVSRTVIFKKVGMDVDNNEMQNFMYKKPRIISENQIDKNIEEKQYDKMIDNHIQGINCLKDTLK